MNLEITLFVGVLALLLLLAYSLWRGSNVGQTEFFPSQRARMVNAVRLRTGGLLAVALVAVVTQFVIGQKRLDALAEKEASLLQYQSEILRLRVDSQLARNQAESAETVAEAPATSGLRPVAATAQELAQVGVTRAVVRDRPAGRAQFTLNSGMRVQLRGEPTNGSGRLWREAYTDDGRHGWIATEVLVAVKG